MPSPIIRITFLGDAENAAEASSISAMVAIRIVLRLSISVS
jgi:hypothetical protein